MFPSQNVHYIRHYNVGYGDVNYPRSTEYKNRYTDLADRSKSPYLLRNSINAKSSQGNPASDAYDSLLNASMDRIDRPQQFRSESNPPATATNIGINRNPYAPIREIHATNDPSILRDFDSKRSAEHPYYQPAVNSLKQEQERKPILPQVIVPDVAAINLSSTANSNENQQAIEAANKVEENEIQKLNQKDSQQSYATNSQGRDADRDEWVMLMKHQTKVADLAEKREVADRKLRSQKYKEDLDYQTQFKNGKMTMEKNARKKDLDLVNLRNVELDKLERERLAKEKEYKEITRKEYDKQIAEQCPYGVSTVKQTSSKHLLEDDTKSRYSNQRDSSDDPFYLQDLNRRRYCQVFFDNDSMLLETRRR